ncbi:unnamed protein product [Parnassius mnemosyne]|uniref:Telomere-associated protein RIF1 n=1 Tax=Parnassius mnemosyne TaxID=213953 RepID=A0AAV1KFD2_9NEOP
MPEDQSIGPDLERVLEHLDDFALNAQNYQTIHDALEKTQGNIKVTVVEKLLNICVRDLKEDMKNTVNTLNVLVAVLNKIKAGEFHQLPDLVPSAVAVLHIIKTTALLNKVEGLKMLCFEILLSYPNDVLVTLGVSHYSEIMEMLNLYCHQRIPLEMRLQPMNIIFKLLKILPPDKKTLFVREGVGVWFSKVVPTVMAFATSVNTKNTMPIETLEMLTEELVAIDYADHPNWQMVLECIYTPHKYPAIMKNLLEAGSDLWSRLWMIFIKLLKNQITKSNNSVGSPINSMLPVVETAFKMNVKNRCRAFLCWNVLIDNFSTETNEVYINKRLKLLIIPLTSNNAKVEETALAKLNTWWHLIRQFETKIEKFSDTVLLPFLHFCFGKSTVPEKPVFAPGLLTINTKRQVLQAFANIAGHVNCDCTVNIAKLNSKILTSKLLVNHWKTWVNSLTMTIRICVNDNSDSATQHFKCIWKSFIATIAEVSDSNIRHNLFIDLLTILEVLIQSPRCDKLADLIFNVVTYSLLDHNEKVQPLFKAENEENNPIHKIVNLILNPKLDYVFTRYDAKEIVTKIKPLTNFIADEYLNQVIEGYLKKPLVKNNSLMLWTALSESICKLKCDTSVEMLRNMLLLPLKSMSLFTSVEISVSAWISLYNYGKSKLSTTSIDEDISEMISDRNFTSAANKHFIFRTSLALLNNRISSENENLILKISETLQYVTNGMDYLYVEHDLPFFVNILILLLNKVNKVTNTKLAETTISTINNLLKMISRYYKQQSENDNQVLNVVVKLFEPLDSIFRKEDYTNLKSIILDELKKFMPYLKHNSVEKTVLTTVNNILNQKLNKSAPAAVLSTGMPPGNQKLHEDKVSASNLSSDDHNKFTAPVVKPVTKKGKKKESNIIDTVVENGEEYVVVNSNWKFNPKKLTDNQKEKLQRKREDIPALYQDLSQSQDEFKRAFRTNSVDSSTSSKSNTTEKEDTSLILKNMPCSSVVPRIIENILTESVKKANPDNINREIIENNLNSDQKQLDIKSPKSPRVNLKDRVFRNVRNLIEKSGMQKDVGELNSTVSDNFITTPPPKQDFNVNIVNSAPPEITSERPSRVKRKPKKFDDLNLLSHKKRRNLVSQDDSPSFSENNSDPHISEVDKRCENEPNSILAEAEIIENAIRGFEKNVNTNIDATNSDNNLFQGHATNSEPSQSHDESTNVKVNAEEKKKTEDLDNGETNVPPISSDLSCTIETLSETDSCNVSDRKNSLTPNNANKVERSSKSSSKKCGKRKSRIEKELAIDMVEGHPFLKMQSEKRLTRKHVKDTSPTVKKRKSLVEKLNKLKTDKSSSKSDKNIKDKDKSNKTSNEKQNDSLEEFSSSQSQDVIESSQDSTISTISTISAKPTKILIKRIPMVTLENMKEIPKGLKVPQVKEISSHENTDASVIENNKSSTSQNNTDIELPCNKTAVEEKVDLESTENMDTEPAEYNSSSGEVIEIRDDDDPPIVINTDDSYIDSSTLDTANADTQSLDPALLLEDINSSKLPVLSAVHQDITVSEKGCSGDNNTENATTQSLEITQTITEPSINSQSKDVNTDSSPFKDEAQRKQDFMNNTLEISPIKTMSPVQEEKKSPTPETSSDFVVITLSSPVQSNGEPFDKSDSPEIFTNDKLSPDKRDQSPPREEFIINNSSPSSSLSLKKNRPQVRPSGRAAQMLGLCVPDRLQTIINPEKSTEPEENKKSMAMNTSARRNLRILYNSTNENNESCDENEDNDYFLKLKRSLPTADCSPSGPILKRKLADIIDEATVSPASKRKRVSFHDPPVSTTVCVKKYIEPSGIRSPQNSAYKRQERQIRAQTNMKSPKRLDSVFKLENVLTKTVESFVENDKNMTNVDDSEMSSLEQTPVAEVLRTTDLNDTDPICPALVNCKDPIDNIATELSSPAMKLLLIREFEGKVETVGDLAKMTELEVNRLCIKAPKVQVAKRVLSDYASKIEILDEVELTKTNEVYEKEETMVLKFDECDNQLETDVVSKNIEVQTEALLVTVASTQTDNILTRNIAAQTNESGETSTSSLITSSLKERPDFVSRLSEQLDETFKQEITHNMSLDNVTKSLLKKITITNSFDTLSTLLEHHRTLGPSEDNKNQLSVIQNYLCNRFDKKDLILFCSELLRKVYEKPA